MRDVPGFFIQLLGIAAVMLVAFAIGYALFNAFQLLRGEREMQRRLLSVRREQLEQLAASLTTDPAKYQRAMQIIQRHLEAMPDDFRRRELVDALQQPSARGRRAYTAKLIRSARAAREAERVSAH